MTDRREMIEFALRRVSGFRLEKSSDSDNRSVFGLIRMLIDSAHGDTLEDCRKPLSAVLRLRENSGKFHGCKTNLLQQAIERLFADGKNLLTNKGFAKYSRFELLEYLEVCRRIYMSKYNLPVKNITGSVKITAEPEYETAMGRAMRLAQEKTK